MLIAKYQKQPSEVKRYVVSYASFLSTGETVVSAPLPVATVKLLNPSSSTDPEILTPALVVNSISVITSATEVAYFVSNGTDGKRYQVTLFVATTASQQVESEIEFRVVEI